MSFFGGMPQYYDRHDDLLNQNRPNPFDDPNKMHPGDARLHAMQRGGGIKDWPGAGPQQGPRMHNPLLDPRINSAGLANIHPDVAAAAYGREMLPRETAGLKFLQENAQQFDPRGVREMIGRRTPDDSILQEIARRRRR